MSSRVKKLIYVTGTDTGVGKTVTTCLLLTALKDAGLRVVGFKPFCSGGRADAEHIQRCSSKGFKLDAINPWYFKDPVAPSWAARCAGIDISFEQVDESLDFLRKNSDCVVVEGAGGLMSPVMGASDSLDFIRAWSPDRVYVVAIDELGVINRIRLVKKAMEGVENGVVRWVLRQKREPDSSVQGNRTILREIFQVESIWVQDFIDCNSLMCNGLKNYYKKDKKRVAHDMGIDSFCLAFGEL